MTTMVRGHSRIHITLVDAGNATPRMFGGAGFALARPCVVVASEPSADWAIKIEPQIENRTEIELHRAIGRIKTLTSRCAEVSVKEMPPEHIGLGTKSVLLLTALEAIQRSLGLNLPERQLQELSGRGGTSGVGINTFFKGCMIVDSGHARDANGLLPSSARSPGAIPVASCQVPVPESWVIQLFLPEGKRIAGQDEVEFFQNNSPIPDEEVMTVLAAVYHGVVPAFQTESIELLKDSLGVIHLCGFKAREAKGQSAPSRKFMEDLAQIPGLASGLSSMGPLVYAITDVNNADAEQQSIAAAAKHGMKVLERTHGWNAGCEVDGE